MISRQLTLTLLFAICTGIAAAQSADQPIINPKAGAKFTTVPNAPECFTIAVEQGDPAKGPSVILARFAPHCAAPFHWHTPSETVMVASGTLETQMKGDKAIVARTGDFVFMPRTMYIAPPATGPLRAWSFSHPMQPSMFTGSMRRERKSHWKRP